MQLSDFQTLLKQTMGLDAASIGLSAIQRAVDERLSACSLKDIQAYWQHIQTSPTELQELIEAVVVPETWFFRDREAFTAMARIASTEWLRDHQGGMYRLLSLPCSTGEEPYSMAMALLDARFPIDRFRIDAVDISLRALTKAQYAVYGKNSFRGTELNFRDRYFQSTPHGHRLTKSVHDQVHFQQGNLFDGNLLPGNEIYNVIFCRNVLIYFDRPTQDRAIEVLTRLLTPDGLLFVGPSEANLLLDHNFVSAKVPQTFAFRKAGTNTHNLASPSPLQTMRLPLPGQATRSPPPFSMPPMLPKRPVAPLGQPAVSFSCIDIAEQLANAGLLTEAAQHCQDHLHKHGPSAKAFYILGLVRDAAGNHMEAGDSYRKALYLDPNHHEALLQLAFLLQRTGDRTGARLLQERARRLMQK